MMNHHPINSDNSIPVGLPLKKRRVEEEQVCPSKKQRVNRHVTWNEMPEIRQQEDVRKLFEDYSESNIWYSRIEYDKFLVDRLRTVQYLRSSGGDVKALDPEVFSVRGLEPFQTADVHQELHTKRRFHQSTIIIEQVRQKCLGIRDLERYRLLVAPQSELALRRAQELAAVDEHEVYGRVSCRRRSLITSMPMNQSAGSADMSLAQRIRLLQEQNARKLMEIYSQPGNNPFRFPIRRDSLVGSNTGGMESIAFATRFPIRRDSLGAAYR